MAPASGWHRNATACATSSGRTSLPAGLLDANAARASAGERPVVAAMLAVARTTKSVSVKPGADGVHGDAVPDRFQRQRTGDADQRMLRRDIGSGVGVAPQPRGAGDVDDPPEATRPHLRQHRLTGRYRGEHVQLEHSPEVVGLVFRERYRQRATGIVHQDVAPLEGAEGGVKCGMIGHIGRGVASAERAGGVLQRRHIAADQGNGRPVGGEAARDRQADPFRAAGDDGIAAAQRQRTGRVHMTAE